MVRFRSWNNSMAACLSISVWLYDMRTHSTSLALRVGMPIITVIYIVIILNKRMKQNVEWSLKWNVLTHCTNDVLWRHRSGMTLALVMACCLTAPSHYRFPVDSPRKGPVPRKMFPFDDIIMPTSFQEHLLNFCFSELQFSQDFARFRQPFCDTSRYRSKRIHHPY